MYSGFATPEGTARFASRFPGQTAAGFFRQAQGLTVSSLGIGTYLGNLDDATDSSYAASVSRAVLGGINFIDTSLNYRNQRSEISVGAALHGLFDSGAAKRDEIVVATKAGYLVPNAVPAGLRKADLVGGMHCMTPEFLVDQIERSRRNLGLETIDIFYLHNPETQLAEVQANEFYRRIREAFIALEELAGRGMLRFYGTATWDGYRRPVGDRARISLTRMVQLAEDAGGPGHRFRFIQLPFNLAMPEAYLDKSEEGRSVMEAARAAGIEVVGSASILQARLARGLPEQLVERMPGTRSDAQRALQFSRSTPGIIVSLVGMSTPAHVEENLEIAAIPPLTEASYLDLFSAQS